jgi:hypothetical protein
MSLPSVLAWVLYLIQWYYPPWYNKFIRACRFWSLVLMQGFDVESKTSGISSSSTLTRPWSQIQVMQWSKLDSKKPRDLTRKDDKFRGPSQKRAESCETRSFVQLEEKLMARAHMQKGEGSRRFRNRRHAKEAGNWAGVGPGQSTRPIPGPSRLPLWPSHHSGYLLPRGREPRINPFVIGRRGAEKRGTPSRRREGRASWLGSP